MGLNSQGKTVVLNSNPFQSNTQDPTMIAFGLFVLLIAVFMGFVIIVEVLA